MRRHMGGIVILIAATGLASAAEKILNGGFELESFIGWEISTTLEDELEPWNIDGLGFFNNGRPFEGSHWAQNGFDGCGPGEYRLQQRIFIGEGETATFSWSERIQWDLVDFDATLARTYEVLVNDEPVYTFSIEPETSGDTDYVSHTVELTEFSDEFVEIAFRQDVPECFTGPAQISYDAISVDTADPEATLECTTSCLLTCPGGRLVYALRGVNDSGAEATLSANLVTPSSELPLLQTTVPTGEYEVIRAVDLPADLPPPERCPLTLDVDATLSTTSGAVATTSCSVTAVNTTD